MELIILSILGPIITIIVTTISLAYWLGKKFTQINMRFAMIDKRFEGVTEEFKNTYERLKEISKRFDKLEKRFFTLSEALTKASIETHSIFADFLSIKGLINDKESSFLKRRVKGIFEVYTSTLGKNPLTKEELEFILRAFSKSLNEITIEEMDRAYEIGKRLFSKDFDERGFILAVAAAYIRAYLRQKQYKEKEKYN